MRSVTCGTLAAGDGLGDAPADAVPLGDGDGVGDGVGDGDAEPDGDAEGEPDGAGVTMLNCSVHEKP